MNKKFEELKNFWIGWLTHDSTNSEMLESAYEKADSTFERADLPGGMYLYGNQSVKINEDIEAFVDVINISDMRDNRISFRPLTKRSKAARIAAKRSLVPDVPEQFFNRSVKVRFGWELIQLPIDWDILTWVSVRPKLNKFDNLSFDRFEEWVDKYVYLNDDQKAILNELSGPRKESFLSIVLGDDWKNLNDRL